MAEICEATTVDGTYNLDENGKPYCDSELKTAEDEEECTGETFGNGEFQYCRPGEAGYDPEVEVSTRSSNDDDDNNDDDNDIPKCEDVALTDYAGKCESGSGALLPLCSVMEEQGRNVGCWDDEDRPERTEEQKEAAEDEGIGCQPEDDYCDYDEHCELTSVDCIDDINKGDDGEDSDPDDEEEDRNGDNLFG